MHNDPNNNNLENFFRKSLENYSEVPSDDLWDRIEGNIPPKPAKRFRAVYGLLALLLLLLFGLGYEYFRFSAKMNAVNETVALQKDELEGLKSELESIKSQLQSSLLPPNNESSSGSVIESVPPRHSETSETIFNKNAAPQIVAEQSGITSSPNDNFSNETAGNEISADPLSDLTKTTNSNQTVLMDFAETKAPRLNATPYTLAGLPVLKSSDKNKRTFSVEIYASAWNTFFKGSGNSGQGFSFDNIKLSSDFGALFNLGLNKNWDVQVGVGYNNLIINDAVNTELIYSRDEYDPERDVYTSFYAYTVDTPAGEMLVNTSLSNQRINDGRDFEVGDPFQLKLQYQDVIRYFQLPVFLRYKIGSGKYRFTVKGGFIQKFLLSETIKLSAVNPEVDRLQNEKSYFSNNQTSASTTSMDVLFGAGTEIRLNPRNSFHLQAQFVHSLHEIYPGVKPWSVGLNAGLQHRIDR